MRFTTGSYDDIDAQAARLEGYDQQYQQLSRGRFHGRFASYEFGPQFGMYLENTNQVLAQCGSTPPGHVTLCFVEEGSSPCIVDGIPIGVDDVAFWPSEHEFEARTTEQMRICVLDIAAPLCTPLAALPWRAGRTSNPQIASILRAFTRAGIEEFSQSPVDPGSSAAIAAFTGSFVDTIAGLFLPLSAEPESRTSVDRPRRAQAFRQARDYIYAHLGDGVGVAEICAEMGISRRALEYVFQTVVGMGPARYIRYLQLNQIRREVCREDCNEPLGDIAARWGIWHWSRFSREYREAFGELPSTTRARLG